MNLLAAFRLAILAFACCLLAVAPQAQITYTVTKAADTDDGVCDADCSLREAIDTANADAVEDRIEFAPLLAGQTIAFAPGHGALTITEDLIIDGTGRSITVDAQRQSRVFLLDFDFPYPAVELIELTITGGYTTGDGGGVLGPAEDLFITRCTITGNEAEGEGGGAKMQGFVTESTVSNNIAGGNGGGLSIYSVSGVTVALSTISNNVAGGDGGGLFSDGTMFRNTISGNRAGGRGGGFDGGDTYAIFNTIARNEAVESGGGVYINGEVVDFYHNVVVGNTVRGVASDCGAILFDFGGQRDNVSVEGCAGESVAPAEAFTIVLDPLLADNGGSTRTHALLAPADDPALNPAVDELLPTALDPCESPDQRGFVAPFDGDSDGEDECDAGAVELNGMDLAPVVTLTLIAADSPVVIPAAGGPVTFTATLTNTATEMQTIEAWSAAVLPSNRLKLPVFGPVTVTLGPGETLTRTLVQTVPGAAPAGSYTYAAYVGDFDELAVLDRDTFGGTKVTGRSTTSGNEWTVLDAETGEPVEAGDVWQRAEVPVAASSSVPMELSLWSAYPNPFRSSTEMSLAVPTASEVRVSVYDVLGRRVAVLLEGEVEAGMHRVVFDGSALPSGVYLVRAEAGASVEMQRVTLVR